MTDDRIFALDAPIPVDPNLRTGQLPNGLKYYILPNNYPKDRISMNLLVQVGSIFEDDDQRGLAHITEHMAFNGTTNLTGPELIDFLESLGMRYGAHINAMTSMDFTLYKLQVPLTDDATTTKALRVLREWASELVFLPDQIERERRVALEEWRMYRMSQLRVMEQIRPRLFAGTPYADRLPIGTEESLHHFKHEALRRFYDDWYRPELMSVMIVGAVDPAEIESQLVALFSDFSARTPARSLPDMNWPRPDHLSFTTAYDAEIPHPMISLISPISATENYTHQSYLETMCFTLISKVCSERLLLESVKPNAPFYQAGVSHSRIHPRYMVDGITAFVSNDRFEDGCIAVVQEMNRMRQYGITSEEMTRHIQKILINLENSYNERESITTEQLMNEVQQFAQHGEPMPGIEYELFMAKQILPQISEADINMALDQWLQESGGLFYAVANQENEIQEDKLAETYAQAMKIPVTAPLSQAVQQSLMNQLPEPGKITAREHYTEIGVYEYRLSNGACVWVMPTEYEADSIYFRSYSWGGASLLSDEDVKAARLVPQFAELSGLSIHDYPSMMRIASTLQARIEPYCERVAHGFSGGCALVDLEHMFQLLYLQVTEPRFEETAFSRNLSVNAELLDNRERNPEILFRKHFFNKLWQESPRMQQLDKSDLENSNFEQNIRIYHQQWGHAQAQYFIVGRVDLELIESLVESYIGALPDVQSTTLKDHPGVKLLSGKTSEELAWLTEPKAVVKSKRHLLITDINGENLLPLKLFSMVAEQRLRKKLRDEQGQIYSIHVSAQQSRVPRHFSLNIEFGCDPMLADDIHVQAQAELNNFIGEPITEKEFELAKSQVKRTLEVQEQSNSAWLRRLVGAYQFTGAPHWAFDSDSRVDNSSIDAVMNLVTPLLESNNVLTMCLKPKPDPTGSESKD